MTMLERGKPDLCWYCGADLQQDDPVVFGPWESYPYGIVYGGRRLPFSQQQITIFHSIMKGKGRPVSLAALTERSSSEHTDLNNTVVQVSKLRKILRKEGIPNPIQTVIEHGYRFTVEEFGQ